MEEERILGDRLLRLAYLTPARHLLAWPLFGTALCSRLLGWYADRPFSRGRIQKTIVSLGIDMEGFVTPPGGFRCFNDFFARRVKPGARPFAPSGLCSPADCRLTVFPTLTHDTCLPVKGAAFSVPELLGPEGKPWHNTFDDGAAAVFRLCPSDYHRYHFPDSGQLLRTWRLPGRFNSVHPIALEQRIRVFTTNVREVSILRLQHFGTAAFLVIGAFGVASINDTYHDTAFARGDEMGYFTFGGSTVVILLQKGTAVFDQDIATHSANGIECLVKAGEHIASSLPEEAL